jgi:hypothetical protein
VGNPGGRTFKIEEVVATDGSDYTWTGTDGVGSDRCRHPRTSYRKKTAINGRRSYCEQCLVCGSRVRHVALADLPPSAVADLPEWDKAIGERYWAARNERWRRESEERRDAEAAEFWSRYHAHLASDKWRDLRRRVLERCRGTCEGCGRRPAVHVHHLTYERLGDEMLFDLAAVCRGCHARLHPDRFED